jgi:DNA-binding PadR family transcriptional regulator
MPEDLNPPPPELELTDNEGSLLGVVSRRQPMTAYQLVKVYEGSPVSSFNSSKGGLYPLIRRLKERGFLTGARVEGDGRGTEQLMCSPAGEEALRHWVRHIRDAHTLLEDPLRTKIMSLDLLHREERIEWVVDVKQSLAAKLEEVEEYGRAADVPYQRFVHISAVSSLRSRMDWLDQLMRELVKGG